MTASILTIPEDSISHTPHTPMPQELFAFSLTSMGTQESQLSHEGADPQTRTQQLRETASREPGVT